ncbi:helix-turn-helix domain-containing protein [Rhizobium glycinendophyticum]|uniref:Helix-turn-helix transcriptional regulator n=1 Tax=Rhizobium glycinendophyticum TaxID=2589807 RepID=A0A504TZW3_9HYPH|nr:helix-turn-helix transcriptional regulator [Rhizobium glycinendophyticum]TPP06960.1 helix-turn-helix transcriptional regulator [Rhizobium glycinendophyticum]
MQSLPALLRAARFLLGYNQSHVETSCKLTGRFLITLENGTRQRLPSAALTVKAFYEVHGVEFLDPTDGYGAGIRWKSPDKADAFGGQAFRAARGLADLSQEKLAEQAQIGRKFIALLERGELKSINLDTLKKLELCLNGLNVEITKGNSSHGAGTRWINNLFG